VILIKARSRKTETNSAYVSPSLGRASPHGPVPPLPSRPRRLPRSITHARSPAAPAAGRGSDHGLRPAPTTRGTSSRVADAESLCRVYCAADGRRGSRSRADDTTASSSESLSSGDGTMASSSESPGSDGNSSASTYESLSSDDEENW